MCVCLLVFDLHEPSGVYSVAGVLPPRATVCLSGIGSRAHGVNVRDGSGW